LLANELAATNKTEQLEKTGKKTEAQSKIEQGHRQVTRNMRSPDAFGALAQRTRIRDVTYLRSGNKIANGDRHEGGHKK
jgi:hypothetical protein